MLYKYTYLYTYFVDICMSKHLFHQSELMWQLRVIWGQSVQPGLHSSRTQCTTNLWLAQGTGVPTEESSPHSATRGRSALFHDQGTSCPSHNYRPPTVAVRNTLYFGSVRLSEVISVRHIPTASPEPRARICKRRQEKASLAFLSPRAFIWDTCFTLSLTEPPQLFSTW